MKVIDLLNKIANGEEVKFKLIEDDTTYSIKKNEYLRIEELKRDAQWYINERWLNEEVEILDEEEKDIPLIPDGELFLMKNNGADIRGFDYLDYNFKVLKEKINQVVEELNKRDK